MPSSVRGMAQWVSWISLAGLAGLLIAAAIGDARRFVIPNILCAAVAALSLPYWWASGDGFWPGYAIQVGLAVAVLGLFAALFAAGLMGGGDVKLLAALALWLPVGRFAEMMIFVAIAGGVLTLALLARHRWARRTGQPQIPYGIAIVAGAALVFGEPLVKQFQS
jgi:prepilin peptidase CpaA